MKSKINNNIVITTSIVLLTMGVIFSCKKKEDATPDTSGSTTTTGGSTGGTTTNTLVLNTWSTKQGSNPSNTFSVVTKSGNVSADNTVTYNFQADGLPGENIQVRLGGTNNATTTPTGNYNVIAWTNTVVPNANEAVILSTGFGAYKSIAGGVINVTNTSGSINFKATNLNMVGFVLSTTTYDVSTNLQY